MFRLDVSKQNPEPGARRGRPPEPLALLVRPRATGDLWIGDVGQNQIEEVDVLRRGTSGVVNFGWDVYEGRKRVRGQGARAWPA